LFLVLKAADGRVCEYPIKARIPVPAVNIRIARAADNTLSIVNAGDNFGDAKRPLANGVIRYTNDGSPVTEASPIYDKPFKASGTKVTARFFYLGQYPYAPVTMASQFGIPRDKWKVVSVSGKTLPSAAQAFDGNPQTAWKNGAAPLPQHFAWDLGAPTALTAVSVHSAVQNPDGRIKDYALYASDDGKNWGEPIAKGTFESSPNPQKIPLLKPVTTKCLKLEALSLHEGTDMCLTEIEVYSR
jgi:hypothetical protein